MITTTSTTKSPAASSARAGLDLVIEMQVQHHEIIPSHRARQDRFPTLEYGAIENFELEIEPNGDVE